MLEQNLIRNCEKLTKMTTETQNKKLRLFAKINLITKLEIVNQQKSIFHKLKGSYSDVDNAVLTLSSLILAVDAVVKKIDEVNLNANELRVKNRKQNLKREKLLTYWSIVKTLKFEQNYSFREISSYLIKFNQLEVSYSLIYQMWNEIEIKKEI